MERKIKFRAWDKLSSRMFDTPFSVLGEVNCFQMIEQWLVEIPSDEHSIMRLNDVVLMQYTGLHDKNGVEIYEGDIVTADTKEPKLMNWPCKGFIQFVIGEFKINTGRQLLDNDNDFYAHFWTHENFEIIGNIHQHPELLTLNK